MVIENVKECMKILSRRELSSGRHQRTLFIDLRSFPSSVQHMREEKRREDEEELKTSRSSLCERFHTLHNKNIKKHLNIEMR